MSESNHTQHLKELESFFADPAICRDSFRLLIHFATRLAAAGHAPEVLKIVEHSAEIALFKPLADGLRIHLGLDHHAAGEAHDLAIQIAGKIAEEIAAQETALSIS